MLPSWLYQHQNSVASIDKSSQTMSRQHHCHRLRLQVGDSSRIMISFKSSSFYIGEMLGRSSFIEKVAKRQLRASRIVILLTKIRA